MLTQRLAEERGRVRGLNVSRGVIHFPAMSFNFSVEID